MNVLVKLKKNMTSLLSKTDDDVQNHPSHRPISNFEMFIAEDCENLVRERLSAVSSVKEGTRHH